MGNCHQRPARQKNPNPYEAYTLSEQEKATIKLKVYRDKLLSQKNTLSKNAAKAEYEAKTLIRQGEKDRALFAVIRKKLYDNMVMDVEDQEKIIEKMMVDKGKIQLSEKTNVLKDTNDLIKSLETAAKLEELQQIGEDIRQRELETREFGKLFEEYNVNDAKVSELFNQFEEEVNQERFSVVYYSNVRQEQQEQQEHQQNQRQQEQQQQANPQRQIHDKKDKEAYLIDFVRFGNLSMLIITKIQKK